MDVSSPPRYRRYSTRAGLAPSSGPELPPYTRRNTLSSLLLWKEQALITLKVYSSAKSSKSLPTFFEKENINGQLEIHAEKGDSIQAITANITGRVITGAHSDDSFTFLNHTLPIWSKSSDIPRIPSPSEGASSSKLLGHCIWPLSIPIPRDVTIPTGPSEFSVQYDLTILVSRGLLRADSKIKTAFGYVPSSRPDAPSIYRQLAYQQGTPLPGPSSDPEGWKTLRPVSARGTIGKGRRVEVKCTLSLAKPLCYTRGSGKFRLSILEAFSTPGAVLLVLRRHVRFYNKTSSSRRDVAWNESIEDMGTGAWWPSSEGREREIRLAKDLRPSSEMGHFSISYSVGLCSFNVNSFVSESLTLLSEPVEIVTMHARGPRPRVYSPPAYETASREIDDFYAAMHNNFNYA
ncbi:hypothetical protein BDQ17DRAFT_1391208 [Cyathus striatus]|nr:hypothetical protein BDQ17DRAFT_1391208 [Cyathus striatus]